MQIVFQQRGHGFGSRADLEHALNFHQLASYFVKIVSRGGFDLLVEIVNVRGGEVEMRVLRKKTGDAF